MQELSFKRQFLYIVGVYMIMFVIVAGVFIVLLPTKNIPAELSCPYDASRLKFVGEWSSNNILVTSNNDKYLSKLIFFQANNNLTAINKSISVANKNLDIIGALALTGNLCLNGVCRSGLNEVRGLIGEGVTGSVAFWVANDEIRGDLNFLWQTSTRNLIITNLVTSTQLKGSLKADYIKTGLFLNNPFTFPQNLTVGNNLYSSSSILAKATISTNRAFCLGVNCLSFWPWIRENFVRGSGTANYLAKWLNADTISKSIIYEDNNKIGIHTTSLLSTVNVAGSLLIRCLTSATTTCFTLATATQDKFVLTSDSFGNAYWSSFRTIPENSFILSFYDDLSSRYSNWKYVNAYILLKNQGVWLIPSIYNFAQPYDPDNANDRIITLREKRANHSSVLYKDDSLNIKRIYVFGGNKDLTSGNDNLNTIEYLDLNSTTAYNFVLESATLPQKISDAASIFDPVSKKIYIIGGSKNDSVDASSVLDSVIECYLDTTKKMQCQESNSLRLTTKRAQHRAILYRDKIIVLGGQGMDSASSLSQFRYLDYIEYFDLAKPLQGWRRSSVNLIEPRSNFAAVLFYNESTREDNIYIIGGNKYNQCISSIEKITLSSSTSSGDPIVSITTTSDFVFSINNHDAVVFQKRIFVIGGLKNCRERSNEIYYGNGLGSWQLYPSPLKYKISHHSAISFFHDKPFIFLTGGRHISNDATTSTQVFNSSYPSFLIGDSSYDLPKKLRSSASVIYQDKIFVIGGDDGSSYGSDDVYILNLSSTSTISKWSTSTSIKKARSSAQAVVVQGYGSNSSNYIYLIGGNGGGLGDINNSLDSVEVFNLSQYLNSGTASWIDVALSFKLPTKRTQHGAVVINNKIFVIGGMTPKSTSYEVTSSIIMLDPTTSTFSSTNKWQYVGNLSAPRNRFAVVPWSLGSSTGFYVIGGGTANDENSAVNSIIKCDVYFIPTVSVTCGETKTMKLKRIDVNANLVGNEVIIFGGVASSRGSAFNSVEKFRLDSTGTTTLYIPSVLNLGRRAHISQVYNRKIYVIGGNQDGYIGGFLKTTEIFSNPIYYLYYYLYGR